MAKDTLGNVTTLAEIAVLGGMAYVGYKVLEGLGFFKRKDPGGQDPPGPTDQQRDQENSPIDRGLRLIPDITKAATDAGQLRLTPFINDVLHIQEDLNPNLQGLRIGPFQYPTNLNELKQNTNVGLNLQRFMPSILGPAGNPIALLVNRMTTDAALALGLAGPTKSPSYNEQQYEQAQQAIKEGGIKYLLTGVKPAAPGVLKVEGSVQQVNTGPIRTAPTSIQAGDIPQKSFEASRAYLSMIPNGTPVYEGGNQLGTVYNGGVLRLDGKTYYTGTAGQGNSPQAVYDILHPVIKTTPAQPAVYGMPGGNVLAGNASTMPKEATVLIPAKPAEEVRAQPITAYVPPATPIDSIAANPVMGSTPGVVYVNWQNYQVSKVPISGFGWMSMTEAEARTRGFIK